jgi:hypothetical protein
MIQLSPGSYLQYNVDVNRIMEAAIEFDDIRMIEKHLDLHLTCKLIRYLLFMDQLLLDYLQSADEVRVLFLHQVHTAVFTVS